MARILSSSKFFPSTKQECTNYKGISLLSNAYKIRPKIILSSIEEFTNCIMGDHFGKVLLQNQSQWKYIILFPGQWYEAGRHPIFCVFLTWDWRSHFKMRSKINLLAYVDDVIINRKPSRPEGNDLNYHLRNSFNQSLIENKL